MFEYTIFYANKTMNDGGLGIPNKRRHHIQTPQNKQGDGISI
jgi:hypothetical protein